MLDNKGFDLWVDGYDKSVGLSDEENTYPFAGYKDILNNIYKNVLKDKVKSVLDIGFGTATLTSCLYDQGIRIYGQDFSEEMMKIAKEKMPNAELFAGDFGMGFASSLLNHKYDAIIATYSLHHLGDEKKVSFIKTLVSILNEGGKIYIGDVAFWSRKDLEACKEEAKDYWDEDEFYFVYDELKKEFSNLSFDQLSFCAGILTIKN